MTTHYRQNEGDLPPRYGCQEFREDAEQVILGRAEPKLRDLFYAHSRNCPDCQRYHRRLKSLYRGPAFSSRKGPSEFTREFEQIVDRHRQGRQSRWSQWQDKLRQASAHSGRGGLMALGVGASLASVLLFLASPSEEKIAATSALSNAQGELDTFANQESPEDTIVNKAPANPGWAHRARHFGRVIAGFGTITDGDSDTEASTVGSESFEVGSKFYVADASAMQLAFMGKVLANFEAGTHATWTHASSSLIELELQRGMIALRYDREPSDPVLQIRTPNHLVRILGTVFTVEVEPGGQTAVSVLRGKIEVRASDGRLINEVEAGYRFNVETSTISDLTRAEVSAALPLSNEPSKPDGLADGLIPSNWVVPQLPEENDKRRLESIVSPVVAEDFEDFDELEDETSSRKGRHQRRYARRNQRQDVPAAKEQEPEGHDSGEGLMADLVRGTEALEQEELTLELDHCRKLYASVETRFRAAECLSRFDRRFRNRPRAAEGQLLLGILRMDFARDYQSAIHYFARFLRRAPTHERAELAEYRWVLALTESGRIPEAIMRGRAYLQRYPDGRYVGRILRRLPELKSALK